jgi:hypothetical protein
MGQETLCNEDLRTVQHLTGTSFRNRDKVFSECMSCELSIEYYRLWTLKK